MTSAPGHSIISPRTPRLVYLVSVITAIGGFLFGYDTGVISGALLFLEEEFALSPFVAGVVVSAILVGAFFGAMTSGPLSDRFGRRLSVLVLSAVFVVGSLLAAAATSVAMLIGARVVLGFAVGGASVLVPIYISEAAPPHLRGRLVSVNQLLITIGILGAYLTNALFAYEGGWRWMFGLGVVPAIALGIGMALLPETPRWLVEKGRQDEALEVLQRLRGDAANAERELAEINQITHEEQEQDTSLRDLLQPWVRPALIAGIGVSVLGQASGINTVIYYAPTILESAGLGASAAILATVGIGAVNVVMTIVGMSLIDKAGRRALLIVGFSVMAACLAVLGFVLGSTVGAAGVIAVICLVVYIAAFAVSVGVVVFVLPAEIYPLRIRGAAMSATLMCNWGMNFLVALTFLSLLNSLGDLVTFWIYAVVCVLGLGYALKLVPETKGRSLEEIEHWLRSRRGDAPTSPGGGSTGTTA